MIEFRRVENDVYEVSRSGLVLGRVEPGAMAGVGAEWLAGGPWIAILYHPGEKSHQRLPGGSANNDQAALYLVDVYRKVYGLPS